MSQFKMKETLVSQQILCVWKLQTLSNEAYMSAHILWTLCLDCWLSDISSQNELVWEKVIAILNMSLQYIQQHHWQSRLQGYLYYILYKNKICIWKKLQCIIKMNTMARFSTTEVRAQHAIDFKRFTFWYCTCLPVIYNSPSAIPEERYVNIYLQLLGLFCRGCTEDDFFA